MDDQRRRYLHKRAKALQRLYRYKVAMLEPCRQQTAAEEYTKQTKTTKQREVGAGLTESKRRKRESSSSW